MINPVDYIGKAVIVCDQNMRRNITGNVTNYMSELNGVIGDFLVIEPVSDDPIARMIVSVDFVTPVSSAN